MARNVSGIDEFMEGCDYEILDKVPADYYCPICFKLLCNATQMKCGHVLCQQCLNQHANVLSERNEDCFCPVDRIKVNMQSVTPVLFIDRLILSIQVKCLRNCQWTGDMGNLKEHREKCPSKCCPNEGCNMFLVKSKMKNHKKSCKFNQAICSFAVYGCNVELRKFEIKDHLEQCSKDHLAFLEKAFNELQIEYADKVKLLNKNKVARNELQLKYADSVKLLEKSESQLKKCKDDHDTLAQSHKEKNQLLSVTSSKLRVAESTVGNLKQEGAEKTKVINESQNQIKKLEDDHKELQKALDNRDFLLKNATSKLHESEEKYLIEIEVLETKIDVLQDRKKFLEKLIRDKDDLNQLLLNEHHMEISSLEREKKALQGDLNEEREEVRKLVYYSSNLRCELENKIDGLCCQSNELEIRYQNEKREKNKIMSKLINIQKENERLMFNSIAFLLFLLFGVCIVIYSTSGR